MADTFPQEANGAPGAVPATAGDLPPGFVPAEAPPGFEPARLPARAAPGAAAPSPRDEFPRADAPARAPSAAAPAAPAAPPAEDIDVRLRRIFQFGLQIPPSEAAGVNFLARELGLPPALVAQQYPVLQKAAESARFDPAKFRRENPGLAELMLDNGLAVHPQQAEQVSGLWRVLRGLATAIDYGSSFEPLQGGSIEELRASAMEQATAREAAGTPLPQAPDPFPAPRMVPTVESPLKGRTGPSSTAAIIAAEGRRGLLANELGDVGFSLLVAHQLGENTEVLRRRQIEIQQELGVQVDYGQNPVEQFAIDAVQPVTSQWASVKAGGQGYAVGFGIGALAGLGATRSPVQAAKMGHAVGIIFGKVGFSYGSFKQESGSTFAQLLDEKLDDGTPLDRDVAAGAAFLYGVAAAAVELTSFGVLAESLGPLKTMIAKGEGRAAIREWAADRSKAGILRAIGKQWARSAASEALEEGTQTTLQYAITWAGKSFAAGDAQSFDVEAWIRETVESMYLGGVGGGVMAAPGTLTTGALRWQHLQASRARGEVVRELVKISKTDAALGAPQAVADLVVREARRAGMGEVSAVYLDAEAAEQLFQGRGVDLGTGLSELLGRDVRAQVAAAKAGENLGRIEIPLPEYLEKLGPTGVAEALAGDTAVRAFDATLNEQARTNADALAEANDMVELWQTAPAPVVGAGGLEPDGVARFERLVAAFLRTAAERYGEPARALLARYSVRVEPAETVPDAAAGLGDGMVGKAWTRFERRARRGEPQAFLVAVFPDADPGTLPHEAGHVFLEILADLAEVVPAAGEDYRAVLGWLGAPSRQALSGEQHEQFAEAFAAYLCEAEAPSHELADVFAELRGWMQDHLRTAAALARAFAAEMGGIAVLPPPDCRGMVRSLLGVGDAPDEAMRGVFARMLAAGVERPR